MARRREEHGLIVCHRFRFRKKMLTNPWKQPMHPRQKPVYRLALLWNEARQILHLAVLGGLLLMMSGCGAQTPASADDRGQDPCNAQFASGETVNVVATTGQIGDVVSMIAGLKPLDPTLWTVAELTRHSAWNPGGIDPDAAESVSSLQIVPTGVSIAVSTMLGPGTDPHLFNPSLRDAQILNEADVIFYNGLHLEAQMLKAMAELAQSHCVVPVGDVLMARPELQELFIHSDEGVVDPHIWNSPTLWGAATRVMAEALDRAIQGEQPELHRNAEAITDQIMQAERMILEMFKPENLPVKYLVTAHDAFGYYAQLTDLENIGLQGLSTETEVSAFDVQSIASLIVEKRIPAMFVESSVSEDAVRAVQAAAAAQGWDVQLGGELYSDALGPQGSGGDTYLGMLRHNTITIFKALARTSEQ